MSKNLSYLHKRLKTFAFIAAGLLTLSVPAAFAASITWGTPTTISGDTDVSTTGALVYAYDESNIGTTVNGVPFTAGNSKTSLSGNVTMNIFSGVDNSGYGSINSSPYSGLSSSYKSMIQGGTYDSTSAATVTLNNLTVGHTYLVQVWVNDDRTTGNGRTETVTSTGGNTVTLSYNSTGLGGGVGQYTIGTFTASATTQAFTLTGNSSTQLNAIQVRDTTAGGFFDGASGAIWDAGTTADWASTSGGTYNQAWSAFGGLATFEGTVNTVTINGSVTNAGIEFTTSGYTLAQGASGALTLAGTIDTGSGSDTIGVPLAGPVGWTKLGSGTLTLSGANTFTGNWAVNAGTLNYNGSLAAGTQLSINNVGVNSIVNVGSGASITLAAGNAVLVGNNATAAGALFQSAGNIGGYNQFQLGAVTGGAYGYYNLSGGTNSFLEFDLGSFNGAAVGVCDISGGVLNATNWFVPSRGVSALGILNMTGGRFNYFGPAGQFLGNWNTGAGSVTVLNIANASLIASNATVNLMQTGTSGKLGEINLLSGGLLQANTVAPGSATGTSMLNFNGGTLKANTATATFLGANNSSVNVYSGGGTIDNNGIAITIPKALTAPAGNGLNGSVTLNSGGSGYIGAPAVTFSGGSGSGAAGYATISGGAVTGVVITSPGVNYSSTPTIIFTGGGGTGASATAPTPTANTSGAMTFAGAGTTTLSAANTYTGTTTISAGKLVLSGSGTLASANINVGSGAIFDASSIVSYTLAANQNILGSGVVTGAVTTAATSKIYAGTDGAAGTLSFSNNVTMTSGSVFNLDVSTSASSGNDKVIVAGTLTLNTTTFNITALSGAADLDQSADYVLVSAASISGTPNATVSWIGTQPGNATNYTVIKSGNNILLHYAASVQNPPTITSVTANPSTLARGASTLVTAAVTPGSGAITSVTVSGAALTSTVNLVSDGAGNYTNNATIAANAGAGSQTLAITVIDANSLSASSNIIVTVSAQNDVWNGGGSDNKWTTGGNWGSGIQPAAGGDSVFFDGTTQTTPNMDANFSVAALTFNSGAGSFTITNAANTLTLTGGLTNNSANTQTIDVPVALSGSQTINAASGNVMISRAVSDSGAGLTKVGAGTLTLSAVNTYSGATTIGNGTLTIGGGGQLGGGTYAGNITDNGALNVSSSASQTLSGTISGTGSLTNSGSGTLTLNGTNSYSGGTTLGAGTLVFGNGDALGAGTITANGGTLKWSYVSGNTTFAHNLVANSGTTTLDVASGNWTFNGNISGSGAITRGIAAIVSLYLGGDNSGYTGTFTSPNNANAIVRFTSTTAGSANASWVFNQPTAGRTSVEFNGAGTISFGSLTGSGPIQSGNATGTKTISVGALNLNDIYSGVIANGSSTVALTKVGSGTMTLSGANTYSGGTAVSNGTLVVNGSIGTGAVTVTNAALGGVGTIAGATTLQANSILAPGTNNIGTLTFSSSLTLNATSTNDFVVTANGASNRVAVAGLLTPSSSVVKITSGTALPLGTNTLFTYGTISGSFAATPVFDVAPVHTASIVDDGAGHINLVVPNHAPVAAVYNTSRNSGISTIKIPLSTLATNWSDADGDTINFVSVGTSTNGASLSASGGYVYYTNANNVNDQLTYTIADSFGATATGIVNITVISGSGSQNIASEKVNNDGTVTLNLAGIPGYSYRTQATTNLVNGPWVDISTNTAGTNGLWQVNDSDATNYPSRYYRTVYP